MKLPTFALALLLAAPALAQGVTNDLVNRPQPPTADQVRDEANALITAVRQQRDANADQLAQAMAQIAKLQKQIDAAKVEAKPNSAKK